MLDLQRLADSMVELNSAASNSQALILKTVILFYISRFNKQ
jgi:hypothetical protein